VRITPIPDLHIDIDHNEWRDPPRVDCDVLAVIGDVTAPMLRGMEWVAEHFDYVPNILWIPGNHCFYRGVKGSPEEFCFYEDVMERAREKAASLGIKLLQNNVAVLGGVRFVGATMWSDFSILPAGWTRKQAMYYSQNGRLQDSDHWSQRDRHNDYVEIRMGAGNSKHRFTPSQSLALHHESFEFFKRTLETPFAGETVCLSHMGPASSVVDLSASHSWLYGSSDIEELMRGPNAPSLWLHGHVHKSFDYTICNTRVVCNPRGYPGPNGTRENPNFDPTLTIEVGCDLTPAMRI
jgi:hypothetical protein